MPRIVGLVNHASMMQMSGVMLARNSYAGGSTVDAVLVRSKYVVLQSVVILPNLYPGESVLVIEQLRHIRLGKHVLPLDKGRTIIIRCTVQDVSGSIQPNRGILLETQRVKVADGQVAQASGVSVGTLQEKHIMARLVGIVAVRVLTHLNALLQANEGVDARYHGLATELVPVLIPGRLTENIHKLLVFNMLGVNVGPALRVPGHDVPAHDELPANGQLSMLQVFLKMIHVDGNVLAVRPVLEGVHLVSVEVHALTKGPIARCLKLRFAEVATVDSSHMEGRSKVVHLILNPLEGLEASLGLHELLGDLVLLAAVHIIPPLVVVLDSDLLDELRGAATLTLVSSIFLLSNLAHIPWW